MIKAKRTYDLQWWGWRPFYVVSFRRMQFSGFVQVGPVALVWFG
jgi:hypothetical protein